MADRFAGQGVVGVDSGIERVRHDVDMGGAAGVVAREQGIELDDTVLVGLGDAAEEGLVDVGRIVGVAIAAGNDTRVNTSRVAVPELEVDLGDGLAGVDVDDLDVKVQRHSLLVLGDVAADQLALDPVRALGSLGSEDAGVVASEEGSGVSVGSDASEIGGVGSGKDGVHVTSTQVVLVCNNGQFVSPW